MSDSISNLNDFRRDPNLYMGGQVGADDAQRIRKLAREGLRPTVRHLKQALFTGQLQTTIAMIESGGAAHLAQHPASFLDVLHQGFVTQPLYACDYTDWQAVPPAAKEQAMLGLTKVLLASGLDLAAVESFVADEKQWLREHTYGQTVAQFEKSGLVSYLKAVVEGREPTPTQESLAQEGIMLDLQREAREEALKAKHADEQEARDAQVYFNPDALRAEDCSHPPHAAGLSAPLLVKGRIVEPKHEIE